ncbi:MAG: hypothetical protein ABI778_06380, partial [Ignavibacteriota bacterium]
MHQPLGSYRYLLFAAALLLLLPRAGFGQKQKKDNFGKEFYFAFAENHGSGVESKNYFALFITSKIATSGMVEVKGLGWSTAFTTTPDKITSIELPDGKYVGDPTVECTMAEQVLVGMGVHVTANEDIAVYGVSHKEYSS